MDVPVRTHLFLSFKTYQSFFFFFLRIATKDMRSVSWGIHHKHMLKHGFGTPPHTF